MFILLSCPDEESRILVVTIKEHEVPMFSAISIGPGLGFS